MKDKRYRKFNDWCLQNHPPQSETVSFSSEYGKGRSTPDWSNVFYSRQFERINSLIEKGETVHVTLDYAGTPKEIDQTFLIVGNLANPLNIKSLGLQNNVPELVLKNLSIEKLRITKPAYNNCIIKLNNCQISQLDVQGDVRVDIENTMVGTLSFSGSNCVNLLSIKNGCILNISCPTPGSTYSPFTGSIAFNNVFLPRNHSDYLLESAQPYRNMRHHLLEMGNTHTADIFHSAELAVERQDDTRINKIFSHGYELFSDFGSSALRPLIWLFGLFMLSWLILAYSDGATLAKSSLDVYVGWRWDLLSDTYGGHLMRSGYLALQPIVNPLGLFQLKALVVPSNGWIGGWLTFQSLFSIIFITLIILAIRRRFKMQ